MRRPARRAGGGCDARRSWVQTAAEGGRGAHVAESASARPTGFEWPTHWRLRGRPHRRTERRLGQLARFTHPRGSIGLRAPQRSTSRQLGFDQVALEVDRCAGSTRRRLAAPRRPRYRRARSTPPSGTLQRPSWHGSGRRCSRTPAPVRALVNPRRRVSVRPLAATMCGNAACSASVRAPAPGPHRSGVACRIVVTEPGPAAAGRQVPLVGGGERRDPARDWMPGTTSTCASQMGLPTHHRGNGRRSTRRRASHLAWAARPRSAASSPYAPLLHDPVTLAAHRRAAVTLPAISEDRDDQTLERRVARNPAPWSCTSASRPRNRAGGSGRGATSPRDAREHRADGMAAPAIRTSFAMSGVDGGAGRGATAGDRRAQERQTVHREGIDDAARGRQIEAARRGPRSRGEQLDAQRPLVPGVIERIDEHVSADPFALACTIGAAPPGRARRARAPRASPPPVFSSMCRSNVSRPLASCHGEGRSRTPGECALVRTCRGSARAGAAPPRSASRAHLCRWTRVRSPGAPVPAPTVGASPARDADTRGRRLVPRTVGRTGDRLR